MKFEALWHRLTPLYDAGEAKAIVRWLLDVRFGLSMADILCDKMKELSKEDQKALERMMQRLESGEPVQYISGVADFFGRSFHVAPGVLIPRPETAELCEYVLSCRKTEGKILHTCLNSSEHKWEEVLPALGHVGANIAFEKRDILNTSLSTSQTWDVIVSNPPYIKPKERNGMEKNVLDYEPHLALFAPEQNPIIFYQRIGDYAWQSLNLGGQLFFELNPLTADDVESYLSNLGFSDIEIRQDQFGKQRFLKAKKI